MAKLTMKSESGRERSYLLTDAVTMAGRASTNPIQINDEKSSRQQFKIERRDGQFFVVDMDSTNGTRLNGARLTTPTALADGDIVMVGKVALTFRIDDNYEIKNPSTNESIIEPETANKVTVINDPSLAKTVQSDAKPSARATGPVYVLRIVEGALAGKVVPLANEPLTLGRHASNTVQIDDEGASNYHAEISREAVGYVVSDLGSTNGTRIKAKNRSEFEKVVKTPLKPGTQIKIGKTLLEFQNIGEPDEDDGPPVAALPMDAKKLDAQLTASSAPSFGGGYGGAGSTGFGLKAGVAAAIVVVLGLAGWLIVSRKSGDGPTKPGTTDIAVKSTPSNLLPNSGFDTEPDEEGYPKEYNVLRGAPEAMISITAEAEHPGEKPEAQKHGLQISKGGAKSLQKPTVVETRDAVAVDSTKAYEIGAWMRNDEDGIYGLRITWIEGEKTLAECPIVMKGSQGWGKEPKSVTVSPPAWASRAKIGAFVQGKNGKTCFDEIFFREKPGAAPQKQPSIKNSGIVLQFEGAKGAFSVESQGKSILEDGTLRLVASESKSASDLSSAFKPSIAKGESNAVEVDGKMYDFAQQDFAKYSMTAKPGASGVDLGVTMELPQDTASKPVMRFFIVGKAGEGDIEIARQGGAISRVPAGENKDEKDVKSVLFNAGKTPQFDLLFGKPAEISLKREGKRCFVEIKFDGEILISMAPEDVAQKQEMIAAAAEIRKTVDAKDWGGVEAKLKPFIEKYGDRFPQAADDAAKAKSAKDAAWKAAKDDLDRMVGTLQNAATPELVEKARQAHQRQLDAWKNTEHAAALADILAQIDTYAAKVMDADSEKKAEEEFDRAQKNYDAKNYNVAKALLEQSVLGNPKLAKTKVAEKARELLAKATKEFDKQKVIDVITNNLIAITKNYIAQKNYKEAIRLVETDPEYKANKADLKEIQELLDKWKKLAGQ